MQVRLTPHRASEYPETSLHQAASTLGIRREGDEFSGAVGGYLRMGKAREAVGNYDTAFDAYFAAWVQQAENPEVETVLLREEFLLKTYPRSVEQLAVVAAQRHDVRTWRLLARICECKGDYERATTFLTEAVQVNPDDVASLSILARISERCHRMDEAGQWHRRILAAKPGMRVSQFFLAQWHYSRGEYLEAIPYFEQLFFKERGNRVCELYWLLANVHCYGIHGLEKRLAVVRQWHDLATEERPLVHELFLLAGKQSMEENDLLRATQYLGHAQRVLPSKGGGRLSTLREEGKEGQGEKDDELAPTHAQEATDHGGLSITDREEKGDTAAKTADHNAAVKKETPSQQEATAHDAWIIARVMALQEEDMRQRQLKRRTVARRIGLGLVAVLLILGGVLWAHRAQYWLQTSASEEIHTTEIGEGQVPLVENEMPIPREEPRTGAENAGSPKEEFHSGTIVAAAELGIRVSGMGAGDPERSLVSIQQQVEGYLPELQDAYEKARAADPSLMGGLVLELVIESGGWVSQVRFQPAKIAHEAFRDAVHQLVRTWRFPPASGEVIVSYPLLFLAPGIDAASIIAWEKSTAAPGDRSGLPQEKRTLSESHGFIQKDRSVGKRAIAGHKLAETHPAGRYRVIASTPLRSQPRADARILAYLPPRTQVTVVEMIGDYLEVESVEQGPAGGYVYWKDVIFMYY